jgi:uncharacterized protein YydD (DUF2326 family)
MDENPERDDLARLKKREEELLNRIERMKRTMNETGELDTLARQAKLFSEAQEELRRVQDKIADLSRE